MSAQQAQWLRSWGVRLGSKYGVGEFYFATGWQPRPRHRGRKNWVWVLPLLRGAP